MADAAQAVAVFDVPAPDVVPDTAQPAVAPVGPSVPNKPGADEKAVWAKCTDLYVKKDWQGLEDCAVELAALGVKEKAREFHDQAVQETQNEANAGKVRQALRDGNLKEAHATLRAIGEDSVYARPTREAFNKAETQSVDDARRKALGFVNAHDCQSLKRLYQQHLAASTERVAAAVGAFKCTAAPAEPATPKTPPATSSAVVAQPPPPPPKTGGPCDTMNVDEVMEQAATQYSAGYAKAALNLVLKALACKQDTRMYRFAVMYACSAKDLQTAKLYFTKVPPMYQANLQQKCVLEGLKVTGDFAGNGALTVRANIDRGVVLIDDDLKGNLASGMFTMSGLSEGRHTLAIEAKDYQRYETAITIRNGETLQHSAPMVAMPKKSSP